MKRLLITLCGVLTLLSARASTDAYRSRNITMNDGLPANAVRNIVQDPYGFLWFGTDNGLCRYDGTRVQTYRLQGLGINQYVSALMTSDSHLYIGTEKAVFKMDYQHQRFEKLPIDIRSTVTSLTLDKDSTLWVSSMGQGVWRGNRHYPMAEVAGNVSQVYIDDSNQIWALSNTGGRESVLRLNRLSDRFEAVDLKYDGDYHSLRMLQTHDGRLWLGTWEQGLLLMHNDGRLEQVVSPQQAGGCQHIHTLYELRNGNICVGCDDGVVTFNPRTHEVQKHNHRFVYAILNDREGGIWVGTFYSGVHYVSPSGRRFEAFSLNEGTEGLRGNVISRFLEDRQGRIWIGSDDGGLMCFDGNRMVDYPHSDVLRHCNVHALAIEGDNLWIGTYTSGVYVLNIQTGSLIHHTTENHSNALSGNSSYAIYPDKKGHVWVATMDGLSRYDQKSGKYERIKDYEGVTIDIDADNKGRLWLSTQGGGLWCYNPEKNTWKGYRHDKKDEQTLPDDEVNCAHVDEGGRLWIGCRGGLCRYDATHDRFIRIPLEVPSQNVMAIVEDHGALWLTTERGIVKYVPEQGVQRFTRHDGLVSEQFQPNAALKTSSGRIFVGTTNGFNTFYPYQIKANPVTPPVYITGLSTFNKEERTDDGQPLDLSQTPEIVMGYSDGSMFSLDFASLSYCSPEKNQYAYMLEGFDHDWNYVGNQHRANYTNIPPGTYTFRVKATNNDGTWSDQEATLRIIVRPPFWWTWWAKLFYLLIIGGLIWYYIHLRLKRAEQQHQRDLQRLQEEKEKEAREARLNFFTMVAHEIRTPVSLIIGPLEKLKKDQSGELLEVIDRNAHRLLELVNQLLDFRKVEQQSLVMHFAPQNVHELITNVSERFAPTFAQGGQQFSVEAPDTHFTAIIDREGITKVVSNLLTNAHKYTKDQVGLRCLVEPDGEHFRIEVSDNGVGIREEDRQHIFEPFFQAEGNKPGTGIGLNIVKNIVDQHHGTISVSSEVGKGSVFTIILPVKTYPQPLPMREGSEYPQEQAEGQQLSAPLPLREGQGEGRLLIVDDNEDMVNFLRDNFSQKYAVMTAGDGIEALDLLQKHEVQIIISDWMMPRMDGAEFCRQVRSNPLTSHIPFVMLTAKTDNDSKVEGMDVGADVYIEKPFSVEYLEACIRNMLEMRRRLMEKFSTQPLEPVTEIASNPTDNEFLIRMNKIIEDNFSNSELNVNFLADQLCISRSGLFAKIKTLADVTPNEMIQLVRLKKAAQLLKEGNYQINEVCYMVGFSSPSYFSKCFQKQFGIKPANFTSQ